MILPASTSSTLDHLTHRARQLYSLPAVAMQVLELTDHPTIDTRALKDCIENDPALTAKILRVVNSSVFALSREVTDLNQALALLGVKPLKLLVLGFSLPKNLFAGLEADVLARYWRHTLVKAVAAREISQQIWQAPGDEAFIAGLLQDLGMLALIQELGQPYVELLERAHVEEADLAALEMASLGFDHAVLSARLLAHWGLPESLVRAIGVSQNAERLLALSPEAQMLPQVLHVAELVAVMITRRSPEALSQILTEVLQTFRSSPIEPLHG
jgi:HD-like signal output (HDOD) protein